MKKLLLLTLISGIFLTYSCTIDEAEKSIDEFAGTFTGDLNTLTCEENQTLVSAITGVTAVLTKDSETEITGTLSDGGTQLFVFNGELDTSNDQILLISEFVYQADTLFGRGGVTESELELQFASRSCPMADNTFGVTLQFK
jgi:hypothetical protein